MSLYIEPFTSPATLARPSPRRRSAGGSIVIGLVNNMPDAALHSTENQFSELLRQAAGVRPVRLRLSSFPELPRSPEARKHIERSYWPFDDLLGRPVDALIVTGTEPHAARLTDEPYWRRSLELLAFALEHTVASVWSCLAAHSAVQALDGIERRRLAEKRCGVYEHDILEGHPLLEGVRAPLPMPHSRWNELSAAELRAAGYTLLSWSAEVGAEAFARQQKSLLLFFQGHPEYEATTLLKEYRRDVGRFLSGQQPRYPALPRGYFSAEVAAALEAFREAALTERDASLLERFPFAAAAAGLKNSWRPSAVAIYRNWLSFISARRSERTEQWVATYSG